MDSVAKNIPDHLKPHQHKWEIIMSRKTCAICGLVSRDKIFVHDDRLIHCANMTKQYVQRKTIELIELWNV